MSGMSGVRRLLADEPAEPLRALAGLRAEVERRSGELRRRRRTRRLQAAGVAVALTALAVVLAGQPGLERVTVGPADAPPAEVVDESGAESAPAGSGTIVESTSPGPARRVRPPAKSPKAPAPGAGAAGSEVRRSRLLVEREDGLVEMLPDGTDARVLWAGAHPETARWSPDHSLLAIAWSGRIDVLRPATGEVWPVFSSETNQWGYDPDWTPDGSALVFRQVTLGVEREEVLAVVDVRTREVRTLPVTTPGAPKVGPDGRVLYVCGNYDLCVTDVWGADLGLVPGMRYAHAYNWSEDGSLIAANITLNGGTALVVQRFDGSERRVVVPGSAKGEPHWLPDGSGLAFEWWDQSNDDICSDKPVSVDGCDDFDDGVFFVRPDGSGLRNITGRQASLLDVRPG